MPSCLVIGANGFIGSAIAAGAARHGFTLIAVDTNNYDEHRGTHADLLINAAGNSKKFVDTQNPRLGFQLSVAATRDILRDFSYTRFIHLSSGAIYPREDDPAHNGESTPLVPASMSHYGFHKFLAEQLVQHIAPEHLILRMAGFVGPRLKKNAVYDLLTHKPLFVHPDSEFQLMDTRDLVTVVFDFATRATLPPSPLNLSAQGTVSVRQIARWANAALPAEAAQLPLVRSELNLSRAAQLLTLPHTAATVQRFIHEIQTQQLTLS